MVQILRCSKSHRFVKAIYSCYFLHISSKVPIKKEAYTKLFGISLDSEQLCYTNVSPDYRFNPKVQVPAPVLILIQTLVADKDGCRQSITYLCRQVL